MTDLRRNPKEAFRKLDKVGGFIVTKDGKPVAKLLPLGRTGKIETKKDKLQRLQFLSGGFRLGLKMSPKKINRIIDQSYEQMLSRQ